MLSRKDEYRLSIQSTSPLQFGHDSAVVQIARRLPPCFDKPSWLAIHRNPTYRQYSISTVPHIAEETSATCDRTHVVTIDEIMAESILGNLMPRKLIELHISRLEALHWLIHKEEDNDGSYKEVYNGAIDTSLMALKSNLINTGLDNTWFKRSVEKTDLDKGFIPTNLHIQAVVASWLGTLKESSICRSDVTTVGAFSAQFFMDDEQGLMGMSSHVDPLVGPLKRSIHQKNFCRTPLVLFRLELLCNIALSLKAIHDFANDATQHHAPVAELHDLLIDMEASLSHLRHSDCDSEVFGTSQWTTLVDAMLILVNDFAKSGGTSGQLPICKYNITPCADTARSLPEFVKLMGNSLYHALRPLQYDCGNTCPEIFHFQLREMAVMSQLITAVVSAVSTAFYTSDFINENKTAQDNVWENTGLLLYFESLLSCWDDEKIMMEDIVWAMDRLQNTKIVLPLDEEDECAIQPDCCTVRYTCSGYEVTLPPLSRSVSGIHKSIAKVVFRLYPVFLNIGINEKATLAEEDDEIIRFQQDINRYNVQRLLSYVERMEPLIADARELRRLLVDFKDAASLQSPKNIKLLQTAEDITHEVGGVRFTLCKSAKDRTSMAVTLEQMSLVRQKSNTETHNPIWITLLEEMRRVGTRRENTWKNIGRARYAFEPQQYDHLPAIYQPPSDTYGKEKT